jgi:SAM-dependent methyltransferase
MNPISNKLAEPLAQSFARATALAQSHCPDCAWYHGTWQYLRLLGLGKTLSGQSDWFIQQLRAVRDTPSWSILILGCADYSAFAHVIHALGLSPSRPETHPRIVAVDRCATPLMLNQYLSAQTGVPITVHTSDVLAYQAQEQFDLIFTSSFFGYFDPTQRRQLFSHCHDWLMPGGRLSFAARLRTGDPSVAARAKPETVDTMVQKALVLHQRFSLDGKWRDEELAERLRAYMSHTAYFPIVSAQSLTDLLLEVGFDRADADVKTPDLPEQTARLNIQGGSLAEMADYACVVARKKR